MSEFVGRWLAHLELSILAMLGAIAMNAAGYLSDRRACDWSKLFAHAVVAGVLGVLVNLSIPDAMPGRGAIAVLSGMSALSIMTRIRVSGPAWFERLVRGAGSPLDK